MKPEPRFENPFAKDIYLGRYEQFDLYLGKTDHLISLRYGSVADLHYDNKKEHTYCLHDPKEWEEPEHRPAYAKAKLLAILMGE
jgi:hypothetical protein